MATAITKASLQAALETAEARIAELEQQLTEQAAGSPEPQRRDHLEQVVWLQRDAVPADSRDRGYTREGQPYLRFGAQYASVDKTTGRRNFGAYKNLVCYGELAELADQVFASDTRLVAVTAYERPWAGQAQGPRRSDWVVTSLTPIARPECSDAPAAAPAAAPARRLAAVPTPAPAPAPAAPAAAQAQLW